MLNINGLYKSYGDLEILKDINFEIHSGEKIVIIGPSGSGKSTLLRCLNGLETPTSGEIIFNGIKVNDKKTDINKIRQHMGMVFQDFNLLSNYNIMNNLILAPVKTGKFNKKQAMEKATELLDRIGLHDKADAFPSQLSGGQQQRVAITRALMMEPELMLFDEPTSALDPVMVDEVLQLMVELANEGMTMACVTHEMGFAREVASSIIFMDQGRIVEISDDPKEFFKNPKEEKTAEFLSKIY